MTNKKRIISILIALAVLSTSLLLGLPTVVSGDVWDGSASSSLEGSGTAAEPYLIRNAADFAYFANQSRGGNNYSGQYVQLNDNISLNDVAIKPLGGFNGTFDGKGHEISGINITSSSDNQGFFTSISAGTIKNLTLTGSITSTGSTVGGFAGYVVSATFIKCINNLNVTGFSSVGGFCGNINNGSANFTSCTNNGNITATNTANYSNLGGFAGRVLAAATANISLSENTGYIYSQKRNVVGGFIGQNLGVLYVENCINSGKVEGLSMVGGIVADVNNSAALLKIKNTINVGTIKTTRGVGEVASLGAILGYYTFSANSEVFENAFYRNSDYDYNGAADQQPTATPRGIAMDTPSDWTDGTIVTLLNNNEEPAFMQGENYPVFVPDDCAHTDVTEEWLTDDNNHWHKCNICGRKIEKSAHTPGSWVVDTPATPEVDGTTHRECTVCGKIIGTGTFAYGGWDGTVSDFIEGAGTSKDPYLIKSGSDLAYLADKVNSGNDFSGKYISLDGDINLNNLSFMPIGNNGAYFRGTFKGGNHTVSGLNIESGKANGIGFFGGLAGVVEDLKVEGTVTATEPKVAVAGIAGIAAGAAIRHCSFNGTVTSVFMDDSNRWNYLAASGLVSNVLGSVSIDQCSVSGIINGFGRGGGLVGSVNGGFTVSIDNSYCDATIVGEGTGYATAVNKSAQTSGGLVGFLNTGSVTLNNCFFYGTAPEPRSTGMCGPIINHYNNGTFACTNVFYLGNKTAEVEGQEFGTYKTAAQFADGTVLALINPDAENPVFVQTGGAAYPTLSAKYVKKVNRIIRNYTFEDHPGTVAQYDTDKARYNDDGFFKNTDPDKLETDPDYYYIGARLFNYGAWNNSKIHIPKKEFANKSKYGVGFSLTGGATFIPITKTDIDPELFYTFTVDAKVIKTVSEAVVQIGLFRPNVASGTLAFQDADHNTYDSAIKAVKVKLDKKTDYITYKIEISGEEILDFCSEYSYSNSSLFFGVYSPQFINNNKDPYTEHCIALDNFKITQSSIPAEYVPMSAVSATDILSKSFANNYGEHLYNFIENPSFENALEGVWANLPAGFTVKTASGSDAIFGSKYLNASGSAKISVPVNLVKNKFYTFGISVRCNKTSSYRVYLSDTPGGAPLPDVDESSQTFLINAKGTGKIVRHGIYFRNTMKTGTTLYLVLESVNGSVDFDEITLTNKTGWEKNKNYYPKAVKNEVIVHDTLTGNEKTVTIPNGKTVYDLVK